MGICDCPNVQEFSLTDGESETRCEVTVDVLYVGYDQVGAYIRASWEEDSIYRVFHVGTSFDIPDSDRYVKAYVECFKIQNNYAYFRVCYVKKDVTTCDNPTTHYSSGCELLLAYDTDNDGIISGWNPADPNAPTGELKKATDDWQACIITMDEILFIIRCASPDYGSINALCSGCYECSQQFYLEDVDTGNYITGATVEVGGVPCTEYPSIERYQINDLTEGSWYNVVASKTGYTCPGDICKDTFEACGSAITLKLKAEPIVTCDQLVKVVDEDGEVVENALLKAESATHFASCITGTNGEACSVELNGGEIYVASAIEHTTVTPAYFTACTGGEEKIVVERDYCNQKFLVLDQFGDGIEGAEVECKSLWHFNPKCTSIVGGLCGINIKKDIDWTAVATKDGCECLDCEQDFTSCTSTITLTLNCPKGEIESYSAPEELEEGEELTVSFVAKNIGVAHGLIGGFKMHLWIDGVKYDTEPDLSWKSLNHNETWSHEVNTVGALWSMPNHDVNVVIVLEDKYMGNQAIKEFVVTLKPTKKETRLECYDAETTEGGEATLEAKLEYKNWTWHDLEGKTVTFDLGGGSIDGVTDADGTAAVTLPTELVPAAGTYAFTATFIEDDDYDGSTCEGTLTVTPVGVCEYTGHACDGMIDHADVPDNAVEDSTVTCTVWVDNICWPPGTEETRYRVGFTLNSEPTVYSDDFILANTGLQNVSFSFPMLGHDVTLIAEVERCNELGEWEPCVDPGHIREYPIAVVEYPEAYGKIVSMSPECTDDNPCFKEKGDEVEFNVTIKNNGGEAGKFKIRLVDDTTDELIDTEPDRPWLLIGSLEPGETSDPIEVNTILWWGAMPDYDWGLRIEVFREDFEDTPDDEYKFTVHLGGPGGHVLILDSIPSPLIIGEEHTFTGELTKDAVAVPDAPIRIMEKDLIWGDSIAEGTTDAKGEFSISWIVEDVEVGKAEIYAYHPPSDTKSGIQKVEIKKEWEVKKALAYGVAAVGMYTGGSIIETVSPKLKAAGTGLRIGTLIPAALCGLETYKLIKEKIPFI
jgi:hypothetical protein